MGGVLCVLIPTDQPIFDNDIPEYSTEQVVVKPGVTIRDGAQVKTMPRAEPADKFTRAQYDEYLKNLKASSEVV